MTKGQPIIKCKQCNINFKVLPYRINIAKFCSKSCAYEYKKGTGMGKENSFYGKHHTEETKNRLSNSSKLLWENEEYRKKMSDIFKEKYKGKGNPFYGKHHSEETLQKLRMPRIVTKNMRKPKSEEHKRKQSETMKRLYKEKKLISPTKGKHMSEEAKKKLSETKKRLSCYNKLIILIIKSCLTSILEYRATETI